MVLVTMKHDTLVGRDEPQSPNELMDGAFMRIASYSLILGFACLAGAMDSLRSGKTGFYFTISTSTFVAAAIGGAFCLLCWKLMMAGRRWLTRVAAVLLTLCGLGNFLYPLRFVRPPERWQIVEGLCLAICAISVGVALLWSLKQFFEKDAGEG